MPTSIHRFMFPVLIVVVAGLLSTTNAIAATPTDGFIYGTVTNHDGDAYTGFLRWDQEEAFWDDLFHSSRKEYPWLEYVDSDELTAGRRNNYYRKHGILDRLIWTLTGRDKADKTARVFICRFGDIRRLTITGDYSADVQTRDGSIHVVSGYSNDVGGTVVVNNPVRDREETKISWDEIDSIDFEMAPSTSILRPGACSEPWKPKNTNLPATSSGTSPSASITTSLTARATARIGKSRWARSPSSSATAPGPPTSL